MIKFSNLPPWLDAEKKSRVWRPDLLKVVLIFAGKEGKLFRFNGARFSNCSRSPPATHFTSDFFEWLKHLGFFALGLGMKKKPKELKLWIKQRTFLDGELLLCCSFCNIDENIVSCSRLVLPCSTIPRRLKIRLPERKQHRFPTTILWGWATRLMECNNPLLLEVATLWLG